MREALLERLIDEPDYAWLMIDASHVKVQRPYDKHPYPLPRHPA